MQCALEWLNISFQCCNSSGPYLPLYNEGTDDIVIWDCDSHDGIIIAGSVSSSHSINSVY